MNQPRGSGVACHQPLHDGFVPAQGPQHGFAQAIPRHIAEHFGPVEFMYHEIASNLVRRARPCRGTERGTPVPDTDDVWDECAAAEGPTSSVRRADAQRAG
jgi:hypothetical protein